MNIRIVCYFAAIKGLISQIELEDMSKKSLKGIEEINENESNLMMDNTEVLLITANENEYNAVIKFLEPRETKNNLVICDYLIPIGFLRRKAHYIFGRFGMCQVAVHLLSDQGPAAAQSAIITAARCFKKLHAIFAVGVTCGVKEKTELLDVIIADKISSYTDARLSTKDGQFEIKPRSTRNLTTSTSYRSKFKMINWPKDDSFIMKRLSNKPNRHFRGILSGNYLIDNKNVQETLLTNFAPDAYGIEMESAGLFHEYGNHNVQIMLVKAVCDYGDGSKDKDYQPTAALLAAECVHHCLSKGKNLSYLMHVVLLSIG